MYFLYASSYSPPDQIVQRDVQSQQSGDNVAMRVRVQDSIMSFAEALFYIMSFLVFALIALLLVCFMITMNLLQVAYYVIESLTEAFKMIFAICIFFLVIVLSIVLYLYLVSLCEKQTIHK